MFSISSRVCCCCLVTQLCLTLCDPMDCSPLGSSVPGILQARILEWVAISTSWSGLPFLLQEKSGIAGSYDCSMFNIWRNPQAVFLGSCTILHSEGQEFEPVQLGNAAPCHISWGHFLVLRQQTGWSRSSKVVSSHICPLDGIVGRLGSTGTVGGYELECWEWPLQPGGHRG